MREETKKALAALGALLFVTVVSMLALYFMLSEINRMVEGA